jgi:hypothetical protein
VNRLTFGIGGDIVDDEAGCNQDDDFEDVCTAMRQESNGIPKLYIGRTKHKWQWLADNPPNKYEYRCPEQRKLDAEIDGLGISKSVWFLPMMEEHVLEGVTEGDDTIAGEGD